MTDEILEGEELQSLEQDEQALTEQEEEQTIDQMEDEDAPKQALTDEELDLMGHLRHLSLILMTHIILLLLIT